MPAEAERVIVCPHCDRPATAKIKGEAIWDGFNGDGEHVDPAAEWTLVQCTNCLLPSLQLREDYGGGFEGDEPVFIYPAPRRLSPEIPSPLRREWEEAKSCFDAKAYSACTVMVRRTVEGACMELGVKKRTLAMSLKELQSKGLIDGTLAEWATALRIAGNQGAHYTGEPVARDGAEDSLAFAEALLDHVYVLRKRFEAFKKRLDK